MIEIVAEIPDQHAEAIEALYDRTFGPGHFAKTAERLREGNQSRPDLTRVAVSDGVVIGVCRIWPIVVGEPRIPAVFVGPVAVDPGFQGQRLGLSVTGEALEADVGAAAVQQAEGDCESKAPYGGARCEVLSIAGDVTV